MFFYEHMEHKQLGEKGWLRKKEIEKRSDSGTWSSAEFKEY